MFASGPKRSNTVSRCGFGALSSDHFHPWLEENGHSGFSWSWLGAAMATTRFDFGTVNAPGDRYHPAIVAQAAATLAQMFPQRFWMSIGTGEALNEHITGAPWPAKPIRQRRLLECAEVMRALWRGEEVTHRGLITVKGARLYTLPNAPPMLLGAAVSEETAEWLGSWADGLITTGRDRGGMEKIMTAFRRGGGDGRPVFVQHVLSWHTSDAEARRATHEQWRFATLDSDQLWDRASPREFAEATHGIDAAEVARKIPVSSILDDHLRLLADYRELGVDRVFCLNVGRNQREFIETFAAKVLPRLAETGPSRSGPGA